MEKNINQPDIRNQNSYCCPYQFRFGFFLNPTNPLSKKYYQCVLTHTPKDIILEIKKNNYMQNKDILKIISQAKPNCHNI